MNKDDLIHMEEEAREMARQELEDTIYEELGRPQIAEITLRFQSEAYPNFEEDIQDILQQKFPHTLTKLEIETDVDAIYGEIKDPR